MSILTRLIEPRATLENPATPLSWQNLADALGLTTAVTGKAVTPSTALQLTAVYACITLISETMGSLPLILYKRLQRGKDRAVDHPLYTVLHDLPNPEITSIDFRSLVQAHILLYGHGYAELIRNGAGNIKQLWPIPPWLVTSDHNARNELVYTVAIPGENPKKLSASRVLHIPAPLGLSPISQAREALGLTMAAEEYGSRFFVNDSTPGGIVEHPGQLSESAQTRLKKQIEDQTRGLTNKHRLMILEEGMKWTQIGLPPEDSQFLETRKFQVSEIARIFHVPPHMIGDVEKSTSWGTGIEQQNIGFITYTLTSWMERWEQEISRTLLTKEERQIYFAEHLVDGLLRGDAKTRYQNYQIARQNGWLNGNEIRELENMNPADGLDEYLVNGNMVPADPAKRVIEPEPEPEPEPGDEEADDADSETEE
jgi:HK97 family phage portal protein